MPLYPKRKGIFPPAQVDPASIITQMLRDGSITTVKIENLAVTNAKIDNLAVTNAKIGNLAVTTAKIEDLAVIDAKIENLSVSKLTTGDLTCIGTITTGALQTGASGTNRIRIDSTYIAGYNSANALQFYLSAADGKAYAGAGAVYLDTDGLHVKGNFAFFYDDAGNIRGSVHADADTFYLTAHASKPLYITASVVRIGSKLRIPVGTDLYD